MMLKTFLLTLAFFTISAFAQSQLMTDPATGQIDIRTIADESLNANQIAQTQPLKVVFPLYNLNQVNSIPTASCQLKINIGANLVLDPNYSLSETSLKNYFSLSSSTVGGSLIITGQQIAPIPNDFAKDAEIRILPKALGQADISVTFEISNQGQANGVSDEDPQNNFASLQYIIVKEVVPVKFLNLKLVKSKCNIDVQFNVENEVNVKRYEVEAGTNGSQFQQVAVKAATKAKAYNATFSASVFQNAPTLYVRIKSVDFDGKVLLSEVQTISGNCSNMNNTSIFLYPNPARSMQPVFLKKSSGESFDGNYKLQLFNIGGTLLYEKEILLANSEQFMLNPMHFGNKGLYFVKLIEKKNSTTYSLKFELL